MRCALCFLLVFLAISCDGQTASEVSSSTAGLGPSTEDSDSTSDSDLSSSPEVPSSTATTLDSTTTAEVTSATTTTTLRATTTTEDIDECASNPCVNARRCINGRNRYVCICKIGYTGINCESNIDDCASNPCQNNGVCVDFVNRYRCRCRRPYTGRHCEQRNLCSSNPCRHGTCINQARDYRCRCDRSLWAGKNCETRIFCTLTSIGFKINGNSQNGQLVRFRHGREYSYRLDNVRVCRNRGVVIGYKTCPQPRCPVTRRLYSSVYVRRYNLELQCHRRNLKMRWSFSNRYMLRHVKYIKCCCN